MALDRIASREVSKLFSHSVCRFLVQGRWDPGVSDFLVTVGSSIFFKARDRVLAAYVGTGASSGVDILQLRRSGLEGRPLVGESRRSGSLRTGGTGRSAPMGQFRHIGGRSFDLDGGCRSHEIGRGRSGGIFDLKSFETLSGLLGLQPLWNGLVPGHVVLD